MKILLIGVIGFLILFYLYTYIKYKKHRNNQISTVEFYHKNYLERNAASSKDTSEGYLTQKQITKYNSSVDYMEWNDLVAEVNEQKKPTLHKPKGFKQFRM